MYGINDNLYDRRFFSIKNDFLLSVYTFRHNLLPNTPFVGVQHFLFFLFLSLKRIQETFNAPGW